MEIGDFTEINEYMICVYIYICGFEMNKSIQKSIQKWGLWMIMDHPIAKVSNL